MPKTFSNQKILRFVSFPADSLNPYTRLNNELLSDALLTLSTTTFKVYIYLCMHKEMKERFALSKAAVMNALNISEGSYHKAIKELQEMKYIVPDPTTDAENFFIFIDGKADFLI